MLRLDETLKFCESTQRAEIYNVSEGFLVFVQYEGKMIQNGKIDKIE